MHHFGIMEQQSGGMDGIPVWSAGTKAGTDDALGNAEYRTWGGFVSFFRWRTSVMGSEITIKTPVEDMDTVEKVQGREHF